MPSLAGHSLVSRGLRPADALRRELYRAGTPWLTPLLRDRERRAWVLIGCYATLCLLLTATVPLWLLALGPVLWGVPHVMGDVRYLVVVPGYHRRLGLLLVVIPALIWSGVGGGLLALSVALMGVCIVVRSTALKRGLVLLAVAVLVGLHVQAARQAEVVFAHVHNWVGVGWICMLLSNWKRRLAMLLLLALLCAGLLFAPLSWLPLGHGVLLGPAEMALGYHLNVLAPGLVPELGLRFVLVFCFAQSFHYAVWLRLGPEFLRRRVSPRGFASSYAALQRDMGCWPTRALLLILVLVIAFAFLDLRVSRETYLRFALFHGYLELTFLAVWWLEGKSWSTGPARSH